MRRSAEALDRFERLTAWPMLILSVAFVPLLLVPLMTDVSSGVRTTLEALDWMIWAAFAVEYGIRLYLAPARVIFMRRNIIDLVVVVVPFLRPARVVRSARALRLLRAGRGATLLLRGLEAARNVLRRHRLDYALAVAMVVVVAAALIVSEVERGSPDGNISSLPDALWWAISTVTTVGYGDRFPVTAAGRGIAVVLMLIGVGLFGLLAASLASFFVEQRQEATVEQSLREIAERLQRIESSLSGQRERGDE